MQVVCGNMQNERAEEKNRLEFRYYEVDKDCIIKQYDILPLGVNLSSNKEDIINSICSHGYGICSDVKPEYIMEKLLFATDELTGLIWAAAKMRPSKGVQDMEVSSIKKKFKDKKFAAGCSREIITKGAEMLGWELDELFEKTLLGMRESEAAVNEYMQSNY